MSDETTVAPEATETEAAPEASTPEVPAAATEAPPAAEAAPAAPAAPAEPERDLTPEELIEALEASFKDFNDGDIVDGEVVKIDRDEVLLDIGYKSEGVIPSKELSIRHDVDPNEVVKVGDQIEALVLQKEDKEGRLILSKKRAQYERAWGRIEEVMTSGETIKGPVIEVVKGGLILDIGLRGFLPASLVDLRRVRDLHPFVGTELEAKIIELDRNRNNVVLSPSRVPRGVAVRGSQDLPAVPAEGRAPQGHRELHRELRRVRRPGRGGRSRPRLRAQLEARRPPPGGRHGGPGGRGRGARRRPGARARVALAQGHPGRPLEGVRAHVHRGLDHRRTGHQARALRRVRPRRSRHRGLGAHLRDQPRARRLPGVGAVGGRRGEGQGDRRRRVASSREPVDAPGHGRAAARARDQGRTRAAA